MTASKFFERWVNSRSSKRRWASLFAFGHVDRCAGQADDIPDFVTQRLNVQIVPTNSGRVFKRDLSPFRFTARKDRAFHRDHGGARFRRQDLRISASKNVFDGPAEHRVADRGVTEIAILGVDRHL